MNDQTIPADKVRELADKYDQDSSGNPERLLVQAIADLRALLPAQQPTTGLLGKWVEDKHGIEAMIESDRVDGHGDVYIVYRDEAHTTGSFNARVPLDSLTFPHQATKPEDVPAGEAWLVDADDKYESHKSIVAIKSGVNEWRIFVPSADRLFWCDDEVTLISPLAPERPVSDLQVKSTERALDRVKAKYDELEAKYREAQERIKTLEQDITPRTATTKEEYAALPIGSMFVDADDDVWKKVLSGNWIQEVSYQMLSDAKLSGTTRTVLRYGWGDEQPAWRIEHDWLNLKAGEYVIDCEDDSGVVSEIIEHIVRFEGSGGNSTSKYYAPFIVFRNKDAATPEAVAEAKRARDKEAGE